MKKYKKKPVVIEAIKLSRETLSAVCFLKTPDGLSIEGGWLDINGNFITPGNPNEDRIMVACRIPTLEGVMLAQEGDYIIRGIKGELYPCKADIFEASYEEIE